MHGPVEIDGPAVDLSSTPYATFYLTGEGVLNAGTVIAEEAPARDTPGTWAPITGLSVTISTLNGGVTAAMHLPVGAYSFVRLRSTAPIGGGGSVAAIIEGTAVRA